MHKNNVVFLMDGAGRQRELGASRREEGMHHRVDQSVVCEGKHLPRILVHSAQPAHVGV